MSIQPPNPFNPPVPDNEERYDPFKDDEELQLLIKAREIFSGKINKETFEYEKKDKSPLTKRCKELVTKLHEEVAKFEDINDAAYLIFNRYRDEMISATLPIFFEKFPNNEQLEEEIRKDLACTARMLHSGTIKEPIIQAISEAFPDRSEDLNASRIDLRDEKES